MAQAAAAASWRRVQGATAGAAAPALARPSPLVRGSRAGVAYRLCFVWWAAQGETCAAAAHIRALLNAGTADVEAGVAQLVLQAPGVATKMLLELE